MDIKDGLKLKDPEKVTKRIVEFIKQQAESLNREGVVLGLSGGIDSAVGAALSAMAVGRENTLTLFLPERDSAPQSRKDAKLVADKLGIQLLEVSLTGILTDMGVYDLEPSPKGIPRKIQEWYVLRKYREFQTDEEASFLKDLKGGKKNEELKKGIAYHRIKHRLRMVLWYYYGELKNYLVVGNCNKTEMLTGYFVKYGDSGSDIDPIASLYKTQIFQLAKYLGIPEGIIKKPPAPDLMPGMTDEYALQIKYKALDQILYGLEKKIPENQIEEEAGVTAKQIQYVKELKKWSYHMRNLPPSPDLTDLL